MLSIIDIKQELGKNIYIYPIHAESIKSNSIDLHVSEFAWSLATKKSIHSNGYVYIAPNDTGLIYTEESIYVSNRIGGSYHSKVTLVSLGAGHIGTCLDAQYVGCSLVAIHNHSQKTIKLRVGSEFVSLHFWYLNTPDYPDVVSHDNAPGHPLILNNFDTKDVKAYIDWRDQHTWTTREKDLYVKMTESNEFKHCKESFKAELKKYNRGKIKQLLKNNLPKSALLAFLCLLISIPAYFWNFGAFSTFAQKLGEEVIFPLCVAFFAAFVVADSRN